MRTAPSVKFSTNAVRQNSGREISIRQAQCLLQQLPVKAAARIIFPPCCHMFMACNVGNGIALQEGCAQARQRFILTRFKAARNDTFKFYADRVVIAIAASPVVRNPCMPGALVGTDKLLEFTAATDVKVR